MKKRLFIICATLFSLGKMSAQDYNFYGSMTRSQLELYLSKAISIAGLVEETACYSPPCVSSPTNLYNIPAYNANISMLVDIDARFLGRCVYKWGGEWTINAGYFNAVGQVVTDITNAYAAAGKVKPIIQGAIFEYVTSDINGIMMSQEVANIYGIPRRNFILSNMLYPDWQTNKDHVREWAPDGTPRAITPDMSKLETQMWFYFMATQYIDRGIEALHLGAFVTLTENDPLHNNWWNLLSKIRAYASTKNRGLVLLDAHDNRSQYLGTTNQLLFDFQSSPSRGLQTLPHWPTPATNGGPALLTYEGCGVPYGNITGGQTYFGWNTGTDALPYLVELDNYGIETPDSLGDNCHIWGWDEITWFALQTPEYRNDWLKYAHYTVKLLDRNAFFQMPGRRDLNDGTGVWPNLYRAANGYYNQQNTIKEIWQGKYDISLCMPSYYLNNYFNDCGTGANCWNENKPRFLADANGDGKDDIIGFGDNGVYVSYSSGTSFSIPSLKISDFGYQNGNGWQVGKHPRLIGDVNGDGKADIVGFGNNGVMLSLSTGTGYTVPTLVLGDYNYCGTTCWTENHPRFLADVDGDGKDDIIAFGNAGVYVSYSTGTGFTGASLKISGFGYNNGSGWNVSQHPRIIGDVNGDGKTDIVGFNNTGTYLSLSTGNGYTAPTLVLQDFNYNNGLGWTVNHPRYLADVDGDGKDDIVGFGNDGVQIAYSTGTGFTGSRIAIKNFGYEYGGGWNLVNHPRLIGHVNSDNKADIVGFGDLGTYVSTSIGGRNSSYAIMSPPALFSEYGYDWGNGWLPKHTRLLGDIDGDGKDEIVGFGYNGVYVTNCGTNSNTFKATKSNLSDVRTAVVSNKNIEVYPNPTTGTIYIRLNSSAPSKGYYQVVNSIGQRVLQGDLSGSNTTKIEMSGTGKGIYFITVFDHERNVIKQDKVVLQ